MNVEQMTRGYERRSLNRLAQKGGGRLYWRQTNPHWRTFDTDDVAMLISGTARTHFKTLEAIREALR